MPQPDLLDVRLQICDEVVFGTDGTATATRIYRFTAARDRLPDFHYKQSRETFGCRFTGTGSAQPASASFRLYEGGALDPQHGFWWELDTEVTPAAPAEVTLITELEPRDAQLGRFVLTLQVEERAQYTLRLSLPSGTTPDPSDLVVEPQELRDRLQPVPGEGWVSAEPLLVSMNDTGPLRVEISPSRTGR